MRSSGSLGDSYGSEIPVNSFILPSRASLYNPLRSRLSHSSKLVAICTSIKVPHFSISSLTSLRVLEYGAIGAQIGVRLSGKLNGAWLRIALSILVLAVGLIMASELIIKPDNVIKIISGSNL